MEKCNTVQKHTTHEKGFTLLELMVSIAVFSILFTIIIGALFTSMDTNRRARSLALLMNNFHFSLESMTRTIKTGSDIDVISNSEVSVVVEDVNNLDGNNSTDNILVTYKLEGDTISKKVEGLNSGGNIVQNANFIPIISEDVTISKLEFREEVSTGAKLIAIAIAGTAGETTGSSTEFAIETTVSQRVIVDVTEE